MDFFFYYFSSNLLEIMLEYIKREAYEHHRLYILGKKIEICCVFFSIKKSTGIFFKMSQPQGLLFGGIQYINMVNNNYDVYCKQ